jgi:rare lipoprotein A
VQDDVDISTVPDAVPVIEPLSSTGNNPYRVFGVDYQPLSSSQAYSEEGLASWYGTKFHGRRTSSGEPYDMYAMSAAHRTLPLPSYLRVTNLSNQRSAVVKVNDRGPFVDPKHRIIDLSYAAAAKLGIVASGPARVRLEAVQAVQKSAGISATVTPDLPEPEIMNSAPIDPKNASYLQMGEFSSQQNADQLLQRVTRIGVAAYLEQADNLFKVKSGPYVDADQALQHKLEIDRLLNIEARVVFE